MLLTRKKWMIAGSLLLAILLCLAGGLGTVTWWQKASNCENNSPPLRWIDVTIGRSQQKQLIEQFQRFADKHGFNLGIVYYTPNHEEFLMDLTRNDTEILGSNSPFDLDLYHVTFHNNNCFHPTVASDLGGLVNDLKNNLNQIPNIKISDVK
jgi:hypothetical protein